MDAIPFGIYAAPLELFRSDVTKRLSDDEQLYYIQLLHRVNAQFYAVLVASSCDDLVALYRGDADAAVRDRVLVTTIKRQYLHHHCALIVAPEAAASLYAAPAAILHDNDLRAVASAAWLTYFRLVRSYSDGTVAIRLASQPSRVDDHRRSSTTTLTAEEFAQALPVGRRELNLATCDLLELVEAHAEAVTGRTVEHIAPVVRLDEEEDAHETPARSYPPEVLAMLRIQDQPRPATKHRHARSDASLPPSARIDLEAVFVEHADFPSDEQTVFIEDVDLPSGLAPVVDAQLLDAALKDDGDACALMRALQHHTRQRTSSFSVQQRLLQGALDTCMRQLSGCADATRIQQLTAHCKHIADLTRWHRASQRIVVDAVPIYDLHERCTTWRLTLSFPTSSSTRKTESLSTIA